MQLKGADLRFRDIVEEFLQATWEFYPDRASREGLHQYDGRLPDVSPAALARRARDVEGWLAALRRLDAASLSPDNRLDYSFLSSILSRELFELTELKPHEGNPMNMLWHLDVSNYIQREYAPLEQRARAITRVLEAVPGYLEAVRSNLRLPLSRPIVQASIESYEGMVSFYEEDLREVVSKVADQALLAEFSRAQAGAVEALRRFVQSLRQHEAAATADFALGEANYLRLLEYSELVRLPLERLLQVGELDLQRNLARFREVAAQVDSSRSPREVMAEVARDHPRADTLVPETAAMLEGIRQFLIDHDIVSVPSEVRCQTRPTPSFMRWAFAAMDMPGPFETRATESYYYVTPVRPEWTEEQKEQWLTSFNYATLLNVSVHEAYPGHYVHYLHAKNVPSRLRKVYWSYAFSEGWAHYVEEMMVEQGFGGGDPRNILGQLSDALLRDCRYICAIRMHTRGMTLEEATRFFMENAFMEELPSQKEALRGTFDPMYLNYTLGKLMILKLRRDYWREQGEGASLRRFHDTLLFFGAPPVPLVRQAMLRQPDAEVL